MTLESKSSYLNHISVGSYLTRVSKYPKIHNLCINNATFEYIAEDAYAPTIYIFGLEQLKDYGACKIVNKELFDLFFEDPDNFGYIFILSEASIKYNTLRNISSLASIRRVTLS